MSEKETISMIIYSIYKVVNKVNGKVYIGYTNNFKRRKSCHLHLALVKKTGEFFYKAISKYGKENFHWEIIYQSKDKNYCKNIMEDYFIREYDCMSPKGYNTVPGGGGGILYEKTLHRMIHNNPGKIKSSLIKKTSTIKVQNILTKQETIIKNRKKFAEENNIPYSSIGWAIQNGKILHNKWQFLYVKKRTMGP